MENFLISSRVRLKFSENSIFQIPRVALALHLYSVNQAVLTIQSVRYIETFIITIVSITNGAEIVAYFVFLIAWLF